MVTILRQMFQSVLGNQKQKCWHETNDMAIKLEKMESRIDLLQELLLETQSDVVVLQKAKANNRKSRKR